MAEIDVTRHPLHDCHTCANDLGHCCRHDNECAEVHGSLAVAEPHEPIPYCDGSGRSACMACSDAADKCMPWPCSQAEVETQ